MAEAPQKKIPPASHVARWPQFVQLMRQQERAFRKRHWFPHVPLAIAVAGSGVAQLWVVLSLQRRVLLADFPTHILEFRPSSMPFVLIGVAMLIMSVGLLLRSRLSWIIAIVLAAFTVLTAAILGHGQHQELIAYDGAVLIALLLSYRRFDRSSLAAGTLFATTSILLLVIYAMFGSLYIGSQFNPPIKNLITAFYFAISTMTTLGYYGAPSTGEASLFTASVVLLGLGVFVTSLTTVFGPAIARLTTKEKRMTRSGHFVVIGGTPLAYNTYREFKKRKQDVVLVLPQAPDRADIDSADVIVGEEGNLDILRRANADQAQAVLAMRADDSANAFIVLAVRELKGHAKTVVAVNDSKHMQRIRLVQPDMIIAPEVLGGELLAMILNGEPITADFLMQRLLGSDEGPSPRTS